jgi:hypothetical protein
VLAVRKARAVSLKGSDNPTRSSMKSQFAPMGTMRLRANGDPYTMPVVTVSASSAGAPQSTPTLESTPGASLQMGEQSNPEAVAFLAPILPVETVRALYKATPGRGRDRGYQLSLERERARGDDAEDASSSRLAPEWSHTRLNPGETVTIGRESGATLFIDHSTISRRHAEITWENGRYLLRDLDSKNGTFVNGVQLEPHQPCVLQSRDQVRIGTLLTYMFDVLPVRNLAGRR